MTSKHRFEGGCHCGNLTYVFEASAGLDALELRACQCSFCRAHGGRNTSDPKGTMRIAVLHPEHLNRYRFGLNTADFLVCTRCGAYIAAVMEEGDKSWATVNANTFRQPPPGRFPTTPMDFSGEDIAARAARRKQKWTPVVEFKVGG
jgi:hypothetical protein